MVPPLRDLSSEPLQAQVTHTKHPGDADSDGEKPWRRGHLRASDKGSHLNDAALTFKATWREYCHSTDIHGVRYLVDEGRSRSERLLWALAVVLCLICCCCLVLRVYKKWENSPIIVSFAETSTPVWDVPFPAVSVCPETKSRQRVFNYTAIHQKYSDKWSDSADNSTSFDEEESRYLEAVSLICDQHVFTNGSKTVPPDVLDILREVAPPMDEVLYVCLWQNTLMPDCTQVDSSLFTPVMSDEGLCYTFNMLSNDELFTSLAVQYSEAQGSPSMGWNLEDGYPKDADLETFPRRALGNGAKSGLFILLRAYQPDCDYLCRGPVQGFKVLLHNPAEIPRIGQQYFRAPLNQEVVVVVKPSMMTTSKGLKDYDPSRRQCYFPSERHLLYFKTYTQKNCELECSANFTQALCGCSAFYMPRTASTPICGSGSLKCLRKASERLARHEIQRDLDRKDGKVSADECHCLPSCTSLEYDAQTSQADFEWEKVFGAYRTNITEAGEGAALARVSIYFKDSQFITSRRSELYGQTDFLANCGGLLALFTGFSLISLIEVVYYLSVRLWCNRRSNHQKRELAPAELAVVDRPAGAGLL